MDNEQERNEHFKGFAELLIPELDEQVGAVAEWGLEHDASEKEIAQELASRWNTLLAQRAYDLAYHVLYETGSGMERVFGIPYKLEQVSDLTEWPNPPQP